MFQKQQQTSQESIRAIQESNARINEIFQEMLEQQGLTETHDEVEGERVLSLLQAAMVSAEQVEQGQQQVWPLTRLLGVWFVLVKKYQKNLLLFSKSRICLLKVFRNYKETKIHSVNSLCSSSYIGFERLC